MKIVYVQKHCYSAVHDYLHTSIKNLSSSCMIIVYLYDNVYLYVFLYDNCVPIKLLYDIHN